MASCSGTLPMGPVDRPINFKYQVSAHIILKQTCSDKIWKNKCNENYKADTSALRIFQNLLCKFDEHWKSLILHLYFSYYNVSVWYT